MNNKGYGLLELFSIIALISLVAIIAIPQILEVRAVENEKAFHEAIKEVFTETFTDLEEDKNLAAKAGEINCGDFEYKGKEIFKQCKIYWEKSNPILDDLKIEVSSLKTDKKYISKTREEINEIVKSV